MSVHLLAAFADASRPLHCSASCPRRRSLAPVRQSLRVTSRLSASTLGSSPLLLSVQPFCFFIVLSPLVPCSSTCRIFLTFGCCVGGIRWVGAEEGVFFAVVYTGFDRVHDGVTGTRCSLVRHVVRSGFRNMVVDGGRRCDRSEYY